MHRFYITKDQIKDNEVTITGSDVNHIKNVLRLKAGDQIEVFDSAQKVYTCKISEFSAKGGSASGGILCSILSQKVSEIESPIKVTLAQCLPKGKKMDLIIRMATELGVNKIIPVISERSIPKIEGKEKKRIEHWQITAREASEQSGRSVVPEIAPLTSFKDLIKSAKDYSLAIMPWEGEEKISLKNILTGSLAHWLTGSLLIIIGPEGGFSRAESNEAKEAGFKLASIGKRILRCETAAVSTLSQIFYEFD